MTISDSQHQETVKQLRQLLQAGWRGAVPPNAPAKSSAG